jgi:hypothetical protein
MRLTVMNSGIDGSTLERESGWHRIEAAVAKGITAQHAPPGEQCASDDPEPTD